MFVDIYQAVSGDLLGWVAYSHLKEISVGPGQYITNNQALGKTHLWTQAGNCYQVCCENGVHIHVEMWSKFPGRFACYKDWAPWVHFCPEDHGLGISVGLTIRTTGPRVSR